VELTPEEPNSTGRKNTMLNVLKAAALAATVLLVPALAAAQSPVSMKLLSGWDDRFDGTQIIAKKFIDNVEKASNGRIKIAMSGPEVVPPNQQFEPTSRGVFDLNYSTPVYYLGTTGVLFAFFAMPTNAKMWRDKGYWEFADQEMKRFNQKLIALVSGSTQQNFYQIMLKKPLGEGENPLSGRKVRGNKYYEPIVVPLGGSLVNLPGGEIYSALEKGVVDGAAWPVAGQERMRFHEVAKFMMRPRFGTSPFSIAMNLDKFNALSKEDQALLLKAGQDVEESAPKDFDAMAERTVNELKAAGIQETVLDPKLFAKVDSGLKAGVWATARTTPRTVKRVDELYELAKKNGDAE
jgi:TRAP-type mannitol/chloroaromatic compound transport system substrate-binding protein